MKDVWRKDCESAAHLGEPACPKNEFVLERKATSSSLTDRIKCCEKRGFLRSPFRENLDW